MIAQLLIKIYRFTSSSVWSICVKKGTSLKMGIENTDLEYKAINCIDPFFGITNKVRLPQEISHLYGRKVFRLSNCLPGDHVRFITNASSIGIECVYGDKYSSTNMSEISTSGIDVYENKTGEMIWKKTIAPKFEISMHAKDTVELSEGRKEVIFYLPSYASLRKLNIKLLSDNPKIQKSIKDRTTILVYGSSITQGCAASRPGLSYANILGRLTGMSILNYGFSESALAQQKIIDYIANLHADTYIIEYDHNAAVDLLRSSHYSLYNKIRENNKTSLIVLMSRFSGGLSITKEEEHERIEIIKATVEKAYENGDDRIFFLQGDQLLHNKELCFTDDRHPNDYGMMQIANKLAEIILQKKAESDNEY